MIFVFYLATDAALLNFNLTLFLCKFTALVTAFNLEIGITGAILTKLDGDSRGGAALSVKEVCLVNLMFSSYNFIPNEFLPQDRICYTFFSLKLCTLSVMFAIPSVY
jgi:hypothetical protein